MDLHMKLLEPFSAECGQIPGLQASRAERRGQRGDGWTGGHAWQPLHTHTHTLTQEMCTSGPAVAPAA